MNKKMINLQDEEDTEDAQDAQHKQRYPIARVLSKVLFWKRIISIIKDVIENDLNSELQKRPGLSPSPYRQTVTDLMRWMVMYLDQTNDKDNQIMQKTTKILNDGIPVNKTQAILQEVTNNKNNFINMLMKKGFIQYLIAKYKKYACVKPASFQRNFQQDIIWYKNLLANIIYNVYLQWFEDNDEEGNFFFNYLINRGCVEIISAQKQWEQVYLMFLDSIEDCKPRFKKQIVQSPLFFKMEYNFSCILPGSIPFQNTIHKLREFSETYNTKQAILMTKEIFTECMDKEIREFQSHLLKNKQIDKIKGIDPDNRLSCLQYCFFKVDRPIFKSIKYIQSMYEESARGNIFSTEDHIMGVMAGANKYLLFRQADGRQGNIPHEDLFPQNNQIKLLNFKIFSNSLENPYQSKYFKTKEISWIPLFSSSAVYPQSSLKILIKGLIKYICIGVCSQRTVYSHRKIFQEDEQSVFFHVFKKRVYNCGIRSNINSEGKFKQNIYSILMKVEKDKVQWIINDNSELTLTSSLTKLNQKKIFAFVSFCRGAEFQVIDF